jgi:hypothetical protein
MPSISIPGRFNRLVQKFLSTKGGSIIQDVSPELMIIFPLFFGVENRFLEGWDRFGSASNIGPVAAQSNGIEIRNPGGSNVIAVLEKITASSDTSCLIVVSSGPVNVDLATPVTSIQNLDLRGRAGPSCILSTSTASPVGLNSNIEMARVLAVTTWEFVNEENQEITILPGSGVRVVTNIQNNASSFGFLWRERSMEDSELK